MTRLRQQLLLSNCYLTKKNEKQLFCSCSRKRMKKLKFKHLILIGKCYHKVKVLPTNRKLQYFLQCRWNALLSWGGGDCKKLFVFFWRKFIFVHFHKTLVKVIRIILFFINEKLSTKEFGKSNKHVRIIELIEI